VQNKLREGLRALEIHGLSDVVIEREIIYLEELLRWNKKINLTSVTERLPALEKHLLDSLMLLRFIGQARQLADLGSGAGLPGIPLAIARDDLQVVSIESVGKKVHFQKHVKRVLALDNLQIKEGRIEKVLPVKAPTSTNDIVVARALAPLDQLISMAAPLVAPGGRLIAMKGPEASKELEQARNSWPEDLEEDVTLPCYQLPFSGSERCLVIIQRRQLA
jgi:16S rRNA (guanine527-N7)-methyltransferase